MIKETVASILVGLFVFLKSFALGEASCHVKEQHYGEAHAGRNTGFSPAVTLSKLGGGSSGSIMPLEDSNGYVGRTEGQEPR